MIDANGGGTKQGCTRQQQGTYFEMETILSTKPLVKVN